MDKKVTVTGRNCFFSRIMDETLIDAFVVAAQAAGYFKSAEDDVYIPWAAANIVVNSETFTQATRNEVENFGPTV